MDIDVEAVTALRFDDGSPVRAASAVVPFGGGFLVAQDDGTHAAWLHDGTVTGIRVLPPVGGLDTFEEAAGTKHLKPDLEAAFEVPGEHGAVVLLGSGSSPERTRGALIRPGTDVSQPTVAELAPLYAAVARLLDVDLDILNLEGACVLGDVVRWFHRGAPAAGVPTASVDVDLEGLLAALDGTDAAAVRVTGPRTYDLGAVHGIGLAVTDAVALRDGTVLVSAAAEDTPDPREDGPVVGSVLAVLVDGVVAESAPLPHVAGAVPKVEGLAVLADRAPGTARLLTTVDADDATAASLAVSLAVNWESARAR